MQAPAPPPPVAIKQTPPPVIELPPAPAEAPAIDEDATATVEAEPTQQAELRELLIRRSVENTQELLDLLEKVPESMRPALLRAIMIAGSGYDVAIQNLE
jgi:hypothetical protein